MKEAYKKFREEIIYYYEKEVYGRLSEYKIIPDFTDEGCRSNIFYTLKDMKIDLSDDEGSIEVYLEEFMEQHIQDAVECILEEHEMDLK